MIAQHQSTTISGCYFSIISLVSWSKNYILFSFWQPQIRKLKIQPNNVMLLLLLKMFIRFWSLIIVSRLSAMMVIKIKNYSLLPSAGFLIFDNNSRGRISSYCNLTFTFSRWRDWRISAMITLYLILISI